jgi:hypothetical protein
MISIGEYLARVDHERKNSPLTMMLLRKQVDEKSLPVLPLHYAFVKPLLRPIQPVAIMAELVNISPLPEHPAKIFYLDRR